MNAERIANRIIIAAESEGAKREREIDELNRQFFDPAYEGDNRRVTPYKDALAAEDKAYKALLSILRDGTSYGRVMDAAHEDSGAMENDQNILAVSQAIASGKAQAREWFSRLADAMGAVISAKRALEIADPEGKRHE